MKTNREASKFVFELWKGGTVVPCHFRGTTAFRKQETYETIDAKRVFGIDTESLRKGGSEGEAYEDGKLRTLLVPLHFHDREHLIETPDGSGMLPEMFAECARRGMFQTDERPSRTVQRKAREGKRSRRDGRRTHLEPWLSVWFNMSYDMCRMLADAKGGLRIVAAGAESFRLSVSPRFEIEVCRMHFGSSASFEWLVRDRVNRTIMRLLGIDLGGYWKTTLAKAAEALGVTQKIDIAATIDNVYERPFETLSAAEWAAFCEYACSDAKTHLELYHATVALLVTVDARVVRKNGVIPPSAPGASARIAFALAFDEHPDKLTWERYAFEYDQIAVRAYYGGRAFCSRPAVYARMMSLDLKSAYPFQLCLMPDPVTVRMVDAVAGPFFVDTWKGRYGVLVVSGESLDDRYPAFRVHDAENGGRLRYVYGRFENLSVTIPELVIGVLRGALRIDHIVSGFFMRGKAETSFLRRTVEKLFAIKENKSNSKALRDMAKLLMNALYGKLIEVQDHDYTIAEAMPISNFADKAQIAESMAHIYANGGAVVVDDLWFGAETDTDQVFLAKRYLTNALCMADVDSPADYVAEYIQALEMADAECVNDRIMSVREFLQGVRTYKCGQYFLPAYASQITGATSAMLGLMAYALGAIQGDTDSVHVALPNGVNSIFEMPEIETYFQVMRDAGYPSPRKNRDGVYEGGVATAPALGAWEEETSLPSEESVLVRPKVYSHRFPVGTVGSDGKPVRYKQAVHGFAKFHTPAIDLAMRDVSVPADKRRAHVAEVKGAEQHRAMRALLAGEEFTYTSKKAPRKLKESVLSGKEAGEFVATDVTLRPTLDPNVRKGSDGVVRWKKFGEE